MKRFMVLAGLALVMAALCVPAGSATKNAATRVTVVYDEVATEIAAARVEGAELWVTTEDLKRATRFELKPQGVCRDELCFPLPKERRGEFVREEGGVRWFHLTEFARLVRQPFATNAQDVLQGLKPGEGGVQSSGLKPRPLKEENSRPLASPGMTGVGDGVGSAMAEAADVTQRNSRSFAALRTATKKGSEASEAEGHNSGVWYFGVRGDQREGLASLKAPNFTLPDMAGKMHSLADFRGKKVLLVTWASW